MTLLQLPLCGSAPLRANASAAGAASHSHTTDHTLQP